MLIRSQNKKEIVNLDNIKGVYVCGYMPKRIMHKDGKEKPNFKEKVVYRVIADEYILGTYSTEGCAIEVLDNICGASENQSERFSYVFQMPQDSEV